MKSPRQQGIFVFKKAFDYRDDGSMVVQLLILKWQPAKSAHKQISSMHTESNHALNKNSIIKALFDPVCINEICL